MREYKVADVMTREVVGAHPDTPFKELARLMYEHRVSGVPVTDADGGGRLVGIVTEADLLVTEAEEDDRKVPPGPPHRDLAWEENWVRR